MDFDPDDIVMLTPYQLVIPGVDQALALHLRRRAEEALAAAETHDDYIENNPALVTAIDMDQCYEFTIEARTN